MPWCEKCDERVESDEVTAEGTCPVCGEPTIAHRASPWYVKLLVVATVVYLGYRAFQGVTWVVHHL